MDMIDPDKVKIISVPDSSSDEGIIRDALEGAHDLGASIGQGALLSGGDEALAALQTVKEKVTGQDQNQGWYDLWRRHQKQNEADYEKIHERSPILSTVGELGGALLMPGGAIAAAEGAVGKLGAASLMGALGGGLGSKANIENTGELGQDVGTGGVLGLGAGIVAPLVAKGAGGLASKLNEKIEDVPYLNIYKNAIKRGLQEGQTYFGNEAERKIREETSKLNEGILGKLKSGTDAGDKIFNEFLAENPVKLNPKQTQMMEDYKKILKSSSIADTNSVQEEIQNIDNLLNQKATAQDIKNLESAFYQNFLSSNTPEMRNFYAKSGMGLKEALKNTPGYNEAFASWQVPRKAGEKLLGQNLPESFISKNASFMPGSKEDEFLKNLIPSDRWGSYSPEERAKGVRNVIESLSLPRGTGAEERGAFRDFGKQLEFLQTTQEGKKVLENMGLNQEKIPDFLRSIKDQATQEATLSKIQGKGSFANDSSFLSQVNRGSLNAVSLLSGVTGSALNMGPRQLYSMGDNTLFGVSQVLKSMPGMNHLGTSLETALKNKSEAGKNAVLYTIAQSQPVKDMLKEQFGIDLNSNVNKSVPDSPFAPTNR